MARSVIRIENASVKFNLAMQKHRTIRDYLRSIRNRESRLHEFFALKHINLVIEKGESIGIIGTNGSGKSTLLKLIAGVLIPCEGAISVEGTIAPLLELGAGFDPNLTGRENITMNGLILGMSKRDIVREFDNIVEFSEIADFIDVPLRNYSSGMKSRLGFSIATSMKPDILIADEILSTGDSVFRSKCEARMQQLLTGGTTLLYVSHSMASVRKMCKRTIWLDHGQIKMCGDTASVCDAYEGKIKA